MDTHNIQFMIRTSKQFVNEELETVHALFLIRHEADKDYHLMGYQISRLKHINIDSKILEKNGFGDLEDRIREIEWENISPANKGRSDEVPLPITDKIERILDELDFLKTIDDEAAEQANQLEAKYILNTQFEPALQNIVELNLKYQSQLQVKKGVDDELSLEQANNLFNGNAVFVPGIERSLDSNRVKDHWVEMNEDGGNHIIFHETEFNIRDEIADLPIMEILGEIPINDIAEMLEKGGAYKATFTGGLMEEKLTLKADPLNSSVRLNSVNSVIDEISELMDLEKSRLHVNAENPFMSPEAIELLEKEITDHGFTDLIIPALHEKICLMERDFQISSYGKKDGTEYGAELRFQTGDEGKVRFQSYQLTALRPNEWKQPLVQEFSVDRGLDLHLNEALNLMQEKPVLIEMPGENEESIRLWMEMQFDRKLPDGNYPIMPIVEQILDVNQALENFHLPNLEYENIRKEVVRRIERGDTPNVTVLTATDSLKVDIEADPRTNGFSFKAKDGSLVDSRGLIVPQWIQSKKSGAKKESDECNDDEETKKKGRGKK